MSSRRGSVRVQLIEGPTVLIELAGTRLLTDPTFSQPGPQLRGRGTDEPDRARARALEAKPDKAAELAAFLEQGCELALAQSETVDCYAFKVDDVTYGIFDTLQSEAGREAQLTGEIAKALTAATPEMLAKDPEIRSLEMVAVE